MEDWTLKSPETSQAATSRMLTIAFCKYLEHQDIKPSRKRCFPTSTNYELPPFGVTYEAVSRVAERSRLPEPLPSPTPPIINATLLSVPFAMPISPPLPSSSPIPPDSQCKAFDCRWDDCTVSFSTKTGLATHCVEHIIGPAILKHTKVSLSKRRKLVATCMWGDCGEEFTSLKQLAKHLAMESHVGQAPFFNKTDEWGDERPLERKYRCSFPSCGKRFSDSSNRKKHERTHDLNRERFYCTEPGCSKSYTKRADLKVHLKVHKGDLPYKCSHPSCDKGFIRLSELYTHERNHDNLLPFGCTICGRRFSESSRLKKHSKIHESKISVPATTPSK
eukprot:TRINITY_DN19665_c0_g1_i1.p1 TRINITY_DN19665_c0_g1~~TRINITY_DN19665_c0_g1_i1.p1  ORF type:complete len:334 (-),score=24.02 TRINITY_DN19665_c0_g1_i1:10-1011(-)